MESALDHICTIDDKFIDLMGLTVLCKVLDVSIFHDIMKLNKLYTVCFKKPLKNLLSTSTETYLYCLFSVANCSDCTSDTP